MSHHKAVVSHAGSSRGPVKRSNSFNVLIDGRPAQATITFNQSYKEAPPTVVVHAACLLDASGSMFERASGTDSHKTKMQVVLESLFIMLNEVLTTDDHGTVSLFDHKYKQVFYNTPVATLRQQRSRMDAEAQSMGGTTALYDSVIKVLESMRKTNQAQDARGRTILRNLVVFTDGYDCSSTSSMQDMVAELMKPGVGNFHFTFIAVGDSGTLRKAEELRQAFAAYKGKNHCAVITDPSNIRNAFGKSNARLRKVKKELVESITMKLVQNGSNPRPAMHQLMSAAASGSFQLPGGASILAMGNGSGGAPRGRAALPQAGGGGSGGNGGGSRPGSCRPGSRGSSRTRAGSARR